MMQKLLLFNVYVIFDTTIVINDAFLIHKRLLFNIYVWYQAKHVLIDELF